MKMILLSLLFLVPLIAWGFGRSWGDDFGRPVEVSNAAALSSREGTTPISAALAHTVQFPSDTVSVGDLVSLLREAGIRTNIIYARDRKELKKIAVNHQVPATAAQVIDLTISAFGCTVKATPSFLTIAEPGENAETKEYLEKIVDSVQLNDGTVYDAFSMIGRQAGIRLLRFPLTAPVEEGPKITLRLTSATVSTVLCLLSETASFMGWNYYPLPPMDGKPCANITFSGTGRVSLPSAFGPKSSL